MQPQWIQSNGPCGNVTVSYKDRLNVQCVMHKKYSARVQIFEISQQAHQSRPMAHEAVELTQVNTLWTRGGVLFRELFPTWEFNFKMFSSDPGKQLLIRGSILNYDLLPQLFLEGQHCLQSVTGVCKYIERTNTTV